MSSRVVFASHANAVAFAYGRARVIGRRQDVRRAGRRGWAVTDADRYWLDRAADVIGDLFGAAMDTTKADYALAAPATGGGS